MKPLTEPLAVQVEDGLVLIEGPGIAVTIEPEQAAATADRLLTAALSEVGRSRMRVAATPEVI